jgi:hypothetical protein
MDRLFSAAFNNQHASPSFPYIYDPYSVISGPTNPITGAWKPYAQDGHSKVSSNGLTSGLLVKSNPGVIYQLLGYTNYTGGQYVQVYDSTGTINLVTTKFYSGSSNFDMSFTTDGMQMASGIYVTSSATVTGFTALGTGSSYTGTSFYTVLYK